MDRLLPGSAHGALEAFLGHWSGTTQWEATSWGPARTASAEVVFARAAAGLAVTMSYRHTDADGVLTEGVGAFTTDPGHPGLMLYHVNTVGQPREAPARASWQDGTLTIERRSGRGTARHTLRIDDGLLTYTAGLRLGNASGFSPFMTTVCRRVPEPAPITI